MGLDSYFRLQKPLDPDPRLLTVDLVGGMFSGNGSDGSFRGKYYDPLIRHVTEGSDTLYEDVINPADVEVIAGKLRAWFDSSGDVPEIEIKDENMGTITYTRAEIGSLVTLFEVARDQGAYLYGWW